MLPKPKPDEVHLWLGRSEDARAHLGRLDSLLSDAECKRRDAFRFPAHRDAFVIARGLLRLLLGHYLATSPAKVALACGPHGKPRLDEAPADYGLRFNLSHSRDALVFAFASGMEVGVDVEWVDEGADVTALSRTVLRAGEIDRLDRLAGTDRTRLFYRYWTQKEAYLKALGVGLSGDMVTLELTGTPAEGDDEVLVDHTPGRGNAAWTVREVHFAAEYAAAAAVPCRTPGFVARHLSELLESSPDIHQRDPA